MKINKQIIIKPIVSEKSFMLAEQKDSKQYTFMVNQDSNKIEVKEAVENAFGVEVSNVRIINRKGQALQWGKKRTKGRRKDTKKAIVTVSKGEIDLFKVS